MTVSNILECPPHEEDYIPLAAHVQRVRQLLEASKSSGRKVVYSYFNASEAITEQLINTIRTAGYTVVKTGPLDIVSNIISLTITW